MAGTNSTKDLFLIDLFNGEGREREKALSKNSFELTASSTGCRPQTDSWLFMCVSSFEGIVVWSYWYLILYSREFRWSMTAYTPLGWLYNWGCRNLVGLMVADRNEDLNTLYKNILVVTISKTETWRGRKSPLFDRWISSARYFQRHTVRLSLASYLVIYIIELKKLSNVYTVVRQ